MKKVLFITDTLEGGGAEKVLIDILNNIDYNSFNIELILINKKGIYLNQINENVTLNCIIDENKFKNKILKKIYCAIIYRLMKYFSRSFSNFFIKDDYDTVISFLEGKPTELISVNTKITAKRIGWIHSDLSKLRLTSIEKEKNIYENIDQIVFVTEHAKKNFLSIHSEFAKNTNKLKVIYNFVDRDKIIQLSNENIDYNKKNKCILAVGRLNSVKRIDLLIRAHSNLIKEGVENELVLIGEGNKENELKELVKTLRLEKTVKFYGFKNNPYPYIKETDIFVSSSDHEGFSLVIAEAIILGKAIVTTNTIGPSELLENGRYGKIVKCGNVEELTISLKEIINNEEIKNAYENKAKVRSKIFIKENIMKEIESLI